jgi:hypothetical protein
MYAMNEALARERMRERQSQARHSRLAGELAAANRWHYLAAQAQAAHARHLRRANRAAESGAVASAR